MSSVRKSILPQLNDMVTQSILLEESYVMSGTPARLELATFDIPEIGYQHEVSYDPQPLDTYLLIQDPPQPKLLKQLGWNIESDEGTTKPMLATIPRYFSVKYDDGIKPTEYYELFINRYTKVTLDYDYEKPDKVFIVTDVSSNMFNPVFYFLKLAPYRQQVTVDPSPDNDPNLSQLNKKGQFKYLTMTPRESTTEVEY